MTGTSSSSTTMDELCTSSIGMEEFNWIRARIKDHAGIHLDDNRIDLVNGRISRRLRSLGLASFEEYKSVLEANTNPEEEREFINALTTNVTSFFREKHHFSRLKEMVQQREQREELRIWSAGCSSGEEPYSIAMTVFSEIGLAMDQPNVKILATDIDTQILEQAKKAIYPIDKIDSLDKEIVREWFLRGKGKNQGMAKIRPDLARYIAFKKLNLMDKWPIKKSFDAIFCRNVMIYFDKKTQDDLVLRFSRALKPGGYLFVGHSETLDPNHPLLELTGQTVYCRKSGT